MWTEIAGGGIETFYHYLLHLDLSDFNPKSEPPGTVAKRDLAEEPYAKVRIVPAGKAPSVMSWGRKSFVATP